jgi:hypothetical protein
MRSLSVVAILILAGALSLTVPAKADEISTSLGNPFSSLTNGQTAVTSGAYAAAVAGQLAPFNAFCGSISGGDCTNVTWTFNYTVPAADTVTGATLILGILDIESSYGTGNPVASLTLDGTDDLTSLLNTAAVATNSIAGEYNILQINIPGTDFMDLSDGTATFDLTLAGPGHGILGPTASHVSGFVYSTLDITATAGSTPPPPMPEPATSALLMLGLAALATTATLRKHA